MQLILPEIINELKGLSLGLLVAGLVIGAFLWIAGYGSHRFWTTLFVTVVAGLVGLYEANHFHMQPLLAAVLFALTAGILALSLMRLLIFIVGGLACLALVQWLAPSIDAPFVVTLAGGVIAIVMFRLCLTVMTSFLGAMLALYCLLCLGERFLGLDAVGWSQEQVLFLNWLLGAVAIFGVFLQYVLWRGFEASASKKPPGDGDKPSSGPTDDENKIWAWVQIPFKKVA